MTETENFVAPPTLPLSYNGVLVSDMLAFPLNVAARLLGVSYKTLWRYVRLKKLRMSPMKLISRKELERFLAQDELSKKAA